MGQQNEILNCGDDSIFPCSSRVLGTLMRILFGWAVLAVLALANAKADTKEKPAGIIIAANRVQVRPVGQNTPLELSKGDYIFAGDTLLAAMGASAEVAICQTGKSYVLVGEGEFTIALSGVRAQNGSRVDTRDYPPCNLQPLTPDLASARRRALIHETPAKTANSGDDPSKLPLGPTYALVIGVSQYERIEEQYWLRFADADAETFAGFLASPRGGSLKGEDRIKVLTNKEATRDAVRNYMRLYLQKAREKHGTFLLVMAAHGIVDDKTREAHILTHEADPEDLSTSGLPMDEVAEVLGEGLAGLGRMLLFVDVCHAAEIRGIRSNLKRNGINGAIQLSINQLPGQIFSFVSSKETEPSFEGQNWGGGHGAFTYFVLRGLNGDADQDGNGTVSVAELLDYVGKQVRETTRDQQHPKELTVTVQSSSSLSEGARAQFTPVFDQYQTLTASQASRSRSGKRGLGEGAQQAATRATEPNPAVEFDRALKAGRILPGDPQSAFEILKKQFTPGSATFRQAETELRVALENQGQEVVLQYLRGDQLAPDRDSFRRAARLFATAEQLAQDSASVEGRRLFCEGRFAIFEKRYPEAIRLLGSAARVDPKGAYSFNGLGIAYLEQSKYSLAIGAFDDAIRLAPYWVYPRHNLALALAEQGQYDLAIRAYREAMKLGPEYSYVAYNLGLLYERLNRSNDAQESFAAALRIAEAARSNGLRPAIAGNWQEGAEILNALGSLEAARPGRKHAQAAENYYRLAIAEYKEARTARHNLALLLSRNGPSTEAEQLWRGMLSSETSDLAARLAFARYFARVGRPEDAAREYLLAVGGGAFPGIRRELASVYLKLGRTDEARAALEQALRRSPAGGPLLEDLGDVETAAGNTARARERYRDAEAAYAGSADKARVRKKLENRRKA